MNKLKSSLTVKRKDGVKEIAKESSSNTSGGSQTNLAKNPPLPKRVPTDKQLEHILNHGKLSEALHDFLKQEFCVESLSFIQCIREYHQVVNKVDFGSTKDREQVQELRQDILKLYLLPSSEMEINIPDKMKRECVQSIQDLKQLNCKDENYQYVTIHLFDESEQHVRTMLVQDRIGKFQETPEYKAIAE
jgi:hypothetical protein